MFFLLSASDGITLFAFFYSLYRNMLLFLFLVVALSKYGPKLLLFLATAVAEKHLVHIRPSNGKFELQTCFDPVAVNSMHPVEC